MKNINYPKIAVVVVVILAFFLFLTIAYSGYHDELSKPARDMTIGQLLTVIIFSSVLFK